MKRMKNLPSIENTGLFFGEYSKIFIDKSRIIFCQEIQAKNTDNDPYYVIDVNFLSKK